jgi:hypothetical protein
MTERRSNALPFPKAAIVRKPIERTEIELWNAQWRTTDVNPNHIVTIGSVLSDLDIAVFTPPMRWALAPIN